MDRRVAKELPFLPKADQLVFLLIHPTSNDSGYYGYYRLLDLTINCDVQIVFTVWFCKFHS